MSEKFKEILNDLLCGLVINSIFIGLLLAFWCQI